MYVSKRVEIYSNRFDVYKDVFNWTKHFPMAVWPSLKMFLPVKTRLAKHVFGVMNKFRLRSRGIVATKYYSKMRNALWMGRKKYLRCVLSRDGSEKSFLRYEYNLIFKIRRSVRVVKLDIFLKFLGWIRIFRFTKDLRTFESSLLPENWTEEDDSWILRNDSKGRIITLATFSYNCLRASRIKFKLTWISLERR